MREKRCQIEKLGKDRDSNLFRYFCSVHNSKFLSSEINPKICWEISHERFKKRLEKSKIRWEKLYSEMRGEFKMEKVKDEIKEKLRQGGWHDYQIEELIDNLNVIRRGVGFIKELVVRYIRGEN